MLEGRTQILIYIVASLGTTNLDKTDRDMLESQATQRGSLTSRNPPGTSAVLVSFAESTPSIRIWLHLGHVHQPRQVTSLTGFIALPPFPIAAPSLDDRARNGTILHNTANRATFLFRRR
jgi:hypothetical protein